MLTKRDLLRSAALAGLTAAAMKSGTVQAQTSLRRPGFFGAKGIAEAGFIYGLPIVMNYAIMYKYAVDRSSGHFKAPFNQIKNDPSVSTYQDWAVPVPNNDALSSMAWMDLRAEPIIPSVPAVDPKRYYSVQLCDGNTYNYAYIGSRTTGSEAGDYMVVGPNWKVATPSGIKKVFRSSTQFSLATYRTQLFNLDDLDNVRRVQDGYKVQTLSKYLKQLSPPVPAVEFPKIDEQLLKVNFFDYLGFALQFAPAEANEINIRAQLARMGIGPGKPFNFMDLSQTDKLEIALGMKAGAKKIEKAIANAGREINGWQVSPLPGDSIYYNGDWLKRAAAAKAGIYGNDAEEALYPFTRTDSDGRTLDGSKHNYTLTFPPNQLPPVNAFWSLTMYGGKTRTLMRNPINRYLVNSQMLPAMKTNADGSLTIYIQNKSPGIDKEANWLPASNGPIYLVMRLYGPKTTSPSILPVGSGTWRPPSVKRVS